MPSPLQIALDDVIAQREEYRLARWAKPAFFGNADGYFDGTPEDGPMPVLVLLRVPKWHFRVLWGIHKHAWPMDFIYCSGLAIHSRGERTDPTLQFDIRDLPKQFIGRFKMDHPDGCGRSRHAKVIGRALDAGFDLTTISPAQKVAA